MSGGACGSGRAERRPHLEVADEGLGRVAARPRERRVPVPVLRPRQLDRNAAHRAEQGSGADAERGAVHADRRFLGSAFAGVSETEAEGPLRTAVL